MKYYIVKFGKDENYISDYTKYGSVHLSDRTNARIFDEYEVKRLQKVLNTSLLTLEEVK